MRELPRQGCSDPFERLRAGDVGGTARPIAEPRVVGGSWPELERLADETDLVIARLKRIVSRLERRRLFGRVGA
jgi:hypothetical protein